MRVDAKSLEALKRLAKTIDGKVLQSLVAAELDNVKRQLVAVPLEQVPRLQGRAGMLQELEGMLQDAA